MQAPFATWRDKVEAVPPHVELVVLNLIPVTLTFCCTPNATKTSIGVGVVPLTRLAQPALKICVSVLALPSHMLLDDTKMDDCELRRLDLTANVKDP